MTSSQIYNCINAQQTENFVIMIIEIFHNNIE